MATQVELGTTLTISVTFRDYSGGGNGVVIEPDDGAAVEVYKAETLLLSDVATKISDGNYKYVWEPDETGDYSVKFIGDFTDNEATPSSYEVVITEEFSITDVGGAGDTITLGRSEEIVFATSISPLLVDPEEFKHQYPEATLVEIAELVHKHSVEVERIFKGKEIPQVAYEYIENAVLCALGGVYDGMTIGDGSSITLGDLSVSGGTRFKGVLNRGNATNACERSFVLRQEMLRSARGSKAVVKGSRSGATKLPNRGLKHPTWGERL